MTVISATLYAYAYLLSGGGTTVHCQTDDGSGDNWGAAVNATQADFESTNTYSESSTACTSVGWHSWTIDPAHVPLGGTLYVRLRSLDENTTTSKFTQFYSQNNATNKPYLELVIQDDAGVRTRMTMGVGL